MKRLISLLLAAVMVLSLAACGTTTPETTAPSVSDTTPVETTTPTTQPGNEQVENLVTFFSLSIGENYENIKSITAFSNEDGTVHVEYVGDVKKVGELDATAFAQITAALAESGLVALNGQEVWGEGEANGSMYIEYADGTMLTAGFGGEIPEAYTQGYAAMDAFFAELTASIPEYVAQPLVQGAPDAALLEEMNAILNGANIANLDAYVINEVMKDEYFAFSVGLSSTDGIAAAVNCAPMMMTTAYSLAIVSLDGAEAEAVCADFESNLDWMKWVCVAPSDALIATKDNMVLCLMGADELYATTVAGIQAAGWTVVSTATNPNR